MIDFDLGENGNLRGFNEGNVTSKKMVKMNNLK